MAYSSKQIVKYINDYCYDGFDKNMYRNPEDCIARQRIEYGIDMTRSDKIITAVSIIAITISVLALIRKEFF